MGIVIYPIFAWFLLMISFVLPYSLTKLERIFLFMLFLDLNISFFWIIAEDMKKYMVVQEIPEYLVFLLYRSFLAPMISLLCLNLVLFYRSLIVKGLIIVGYIGAFIGLENMMLFHKIYKYAGWKLSYTIFYFVIQLTLSLFLLLWYRKNIVIAGG